MNDQEISMKVLFCLILAMAGEARATGLKKVNYKELTVDSQPSTVEAGAGGTILSPEENKKLLEQIEVIKAKQAESQKILEELDKDE